MEREQARAVCQLISFPWLPIPPASPRTLRYIDSPTWRVYFAWLYRHSVYTGIHIQTHCLCVRQSVCKKLQLSTIPLPTHTSITLQTNKLRSWHTCPYSQSLHWLPCCCLYLFSPPSGLGFSVPIMTNRFLKLPCSFQFQLWKALVERAEFLFWFKLSHQVFVVTLPV